MKEEQIKMRIEEEYSIKPREIEKVKNVYRVITEKEKYCLKVIKYEISHFLFILSAIKHLEKNDFQKTPKIIKNTKSQDYINLGNKHAYLTPWVESRSCNYDNPMELSLASNRLAELHLKSRGFNITSDMKPRVGWFNWFENFSNKKRDILDFKNIIENKDEKTYFDILYLKHVGEEIERINKSLEDLMKSKYFHKMKEEIVKKGFCHHDYAHHNVLIDEEGSINIIDFDYCILDTHLHDLSSLIIRAMKNGKWDISNSIHILDSYSSVCPINKDDIDIMAAFIEFPQAFWQLGIQYYIEKQPWEEDVFINRLNKVCEDKDSRQEFADEFKNIRY
ncbi:CotS family spore coat protein [Clostridium sp. MSJ-11]|uniref:CotS family spore coat protein n=1 Tax=Clostridium mobile TaxID=2841512 RepID=A0ABS6ELS1_9CLOT|nr:CotS family spore coat protein [Clostridium mobile]MBU5486164.1 CotS family spore coat protein [Clostridium mobile]